MEHLAEVLASLATIGAGALAWKVKDMAEEIKSLRKSRHTHGNKFAEHDVRLGDIERRLEKMGNGD